MKLGGQKTAHIDLTSQGAGEALRGSWILPEHSLAVSTGSISCVSGYEKPPPVLLGWIILIGEKQPGIRVRATDDVAPCLWQVGCLLLLFCFMDTFPVVSSREVGVFSMFCHFAEGLTDCA